MVFLDLIVALAPLVLAGWGFAANAQRVDLGFGNPKLVDRFGKISLWLACFTTLAAILRIFIDSESNTELCFAIIIVGLSLLRLMSDVVVFVSILNAGVYSKIRPTTWPSTVFFLILKEGGVLLSAYLILCAFLH